MQVYLGASEVFGGFTAPMTGFSVLTPSPIFRFSKSPSALRTAFESESVAGVTFRTVPRAVATPALFPLHSEAPAGGTGTVPPGRAAGPEAGGTGTINNARPVTGYAGTDVPDPAAGSAGDDARTLAVVALHGEDGGDEQRQDEDDSFHETSFESGGPQARPTSPYHAPPCRWPMTRGGSPLCFTLSARAPPPWRSPSSPCRR